MRIVSASSSIATPFKTSFEISAPPSSSFGKDASEPAAKGWAAKLAAVGATTAAVEPVSSGAGRGTIQGSKLMLAPVPADWPKTVISLVEVITIYQS